MLCLASVVSCKKEKNTSGNPKQDSIVTTKNISDIGEKEGAGIEAFAKQFAERRNQIISQVKNLSPDDANKLYSTYRAENEKLLIDINEKEIGFIHEHYDSFFDKPHNDEIVKQKTKVLQNAGLEFNYLGEGQIVIRTQPDFYTDIFQNRVTKDYKEYIVLTSKNDRVLWLEASEVIVPWEKIGENVLAWEKILKEYPESKMLTEIKKQYNYFTWLYIAGMDNSPVKEYNEVTFLPKAKKAFDKIVAEHPDSRIAKIAAIALINIQDGNGYLETMQTVCDTVK